MSSFITSLLIAVATTTISYFAFHLYLERYAIKKRRLNQIIKKDDENIDHFIISEDHKKNDFLYKNLLKIKSQIQKSGLSWSVKKYIYVKIIAVLISLVIALILFKTLLFAAVIGIAFGHYATEFYINRKASKRIDKFSDQFPNALDGMVRNLKSNIPLQKAIEIIAENSNEPLKSEFQRITLMLKLGESITKSVSELKERMPTTDVNLFAIAISIQQSSGARLSEVLETLSSTMRSRKQIRNEIKTLSAQTKTSAIILGLVSPIIALIITVINPEYMAPLVNTHQGKVVIIIAISLLAIGSFIMNKMIKFKI